jgi:hypothetical protein
MLVALALTSAGRPAAAQKVGTALRDLATSPDRKVRLAAVVTLAQSGDRRAVGACARALGQDTDASVRVAAMISLRKLLSTSLSAQDWLIGLRALSDASARDKEPRIRKKAAATHRRLMRNAPPFVTTGAAGTGQASPAATAPTP